MFPSKEELIDNPEIDVQLIDYMRTQSAFSIISIFLMFLAHVFAFYSFKRPRYIIKRLTALLHMMTAACLLVLNEVYIKSVDHGIDHIPARHPKIATYRYGFSFILSWISFVIYFLAGCVFLFASHKQKTEMADEEDELAEQDEPMHLGRI
ncbi:epithelial membrane 2-like [Octopus vulgaris]|uniref:Epithelial membrane 2-like n=1 Tax=Octopus vulgaris TaxID=6645 RepID=A0AA36FMP2_OCTVU|nr:epithelial membrane 2-like [Octopus vulgaris]